MAGNNTEESIGQNNEIESTETTALTTGIESGNPKPQGNKWEGFDYAKLRTESIKRGVNLGNYDIQKHTSGASLSFPTLDEFKQYYDGEQPEAVYQKLEQDYTNYSTQNFTAKQSVLKRGPEGLFSKYFDDASYNSFVVKNPADRNQIMSPTGNLERDTKTEQQKYEASGLFMDTDGKLKTLDKYLNNSKKKDTHVLVQELDENGNRQYKAVPRTDALHQYQIRSAYGPNVWETNAMTSLGKGFYDGMVLSSVSTVGSVVEIIGDLFDNWSSDDKWSDEFGHKLQNWAYEQNSMNEDEKMGMFKDWSAFSYVTGSGIASMALMIATGGIGAAPFKVAGSMAAKQGSKALAAQIIKAGGKVSREVALATGALVMSDAAYKEAKAQGLSDKQASLMGVIAGIGTYTAERFIGPNIDINYWVEGAGNQTVKSAAKNIANEVRKNAAGDIVDDQVKKSIIRNVGSSLKKGYQNAMKSAYANRATQAAMSGLYEEPTEEMFEQVWQNISKNVFNMWADYTNDAEMAGYSKEIEKLENQLSSYHVKEVDADNAPKVGSGDSVYRKVMVNGKPQLFTEEQYQKYRKQKVYYKKDQNGNLQEISKADYESGTSSVKERLDHLMANKPQRKVPGQGKYEDTPVFEGMLESGVGAIIPGLLFGGMRRNIKQTAQMMIAEGKGDEFIRLVENDYKKGALGPKELNKDMKPRQEGEQSINDFVYEELMAIHDEVKREMAADGADAILSKYANISAGNKGGFHDYMSETRSEFLEAYNSKKTRERELSDLMEDQSINPEEKVVRDPENRTGAMSKAEQIQNEIDSANQKIEYFTKENEQGVTQREMDALFGELIQNKSLSIDGVGDMRTRITSEAIDFMQSKDQFIALQAELDANRKEFSSSIESFVDNAIQSEDWDGFIENINTVVEQSKQTGVGVSEEKIKQLNARAQKVKQDIIDRAKKVVEEAENFEQKETMLSQDDNGFLQMITPDKADETFPMDLLTPGYDAQKFLESGIEDNLSALGTISNFNFTEDAHAIDYWKRKFSKYNQIKTDLETGAITPKASIPLLKSAMENLERDFRTYMAMNSSLGPIKNGNVDPETVKGLPKDLREFVKKDGIKDIDYIQAWNAKQEVSEAIISDYFLRHMDLSNLINNGSNVPLAFEVRQETIHKENIRVKSRLLGLLLDELGIEHPSSFTSNPEDVNDGNMFALESGLIEAETAAYEYAQNHKADYKKAVIAVMQDNLDFKPFNAIEYKDNNIDHYLLDNPLREPLKDKDKLRHGVSATDSFRSMYMADYFTKIYKLNSTAFENALEAVRDENGIALSLEQIENAKAAVAMYFDGDQSFLDEVFIAAGSKDENHLNNSIYLRGPAGTGKSTVPGLIVNIIQAMDPNKKHVVNAYAPSLKVAHTVEHKLTTLFGVEDVQSYELTKVNGKRNVDTISIKNNSIIFIDEASLLLPEDFKILKEKVESLKNSVVVFLGDELQTIDPSRGYSEVERVVQRTVGLGYIYRSGVADIWNIQNALRSSFPSDINGINWKSTNYKITPNEKLGVKISSNKTDIIKNFMDAKDETSFIIFDTKADAEAFLGSNYEKYASRVYVMEEGATHKNRNMFVQGDEASEVYAIIDPKKYDGKQAYIRSALTAASRAMAYLEFYHPDGPSKAMNREGDPKVLSSLENEEKMRVEQHKFLETRYNALNLTSNETQQRGEIDPDGNKKKRKKGKKKSKKGKPTGTTIQAVINDILSNSAKVVLNKSTGKYQGVFNGDTVVFDRVSDLVYGEKKSYPSKKSRSAKIIGTKVDQIVRDFFSDRLKTAEDYKIVTKDNIDVYNQFINRLNEIKKNMDARGEKVLSQNVIVYDLEAKVAGEIDLLTYTEDGVFRIYDVKTMLDGDVQNPDGTYYSTKYGKSKSQAYQEQLSLYRILLNNTNGVLAKTLGVLPIEVDYNAGQMTTRKLDVARNGGITVDPLDKVGRVILGKSPEYNGREFDIDELDEQNVAELKNLFSDTNVDHAIVKLDAFPSPVLAKIIMKGRSLKIVNDNNVTRPKDNFDKILDIVNVVYKNDGSSFFDDIDPLQSTVDDSSIKSDSLDEDIKYEGYKSRSMDFHRDGTMTFGMYPYIENEKDLRAKFSSFMMSNIRANDGALPPQTYLRLIPNKDVFEPGAEIDYMLGVFVESPDVIKAFFRNMSYGDVIDQGLNMFTFSLLPDKNVPGVKTNVLEEWKQYIDTNRELFEKGILLDKLNIPKDVEISWKSNEKIPYTEWVNKPENDGIYLSPTAYQRSEIVNDNGTRVKKAKTWMNVSRDAGADLSNTSLNEQKGNKIFMTPFMLHEKNDLVKQYLGELSSAISDLENELKRADITDRKQLEANPFYQMVLYNASNINRWANQNPTFLDDFGLEFNGGRVRLSWGESNVKNEVSRDFIRKVVKLANDSRSPFNLFLLKRGSNPANLFVNPTRYSFDKKTVVLDPKYFKVKNYFVNMPHANLNLNLKKGGDSSSNGGINLSGFYSGGKTRAFETDPMAMYIPKEDARALVSRMLGEKFANENIEFVQNLVVDNRALSGLVTRGMMYLNELENGNVDIKAVRHELVHVIFDYMLDPIQKQKLLDSIINNHSESYIAAKRTQYGLMDDYAAAEEILAENFETHRSPADVYNNVNARGITGFFKKLVNFINRFLRNLFNSSDVVERFYNRIENGSYYNKKINTPFEDAIKTRQRDIYSERSYMTKWLPDYTIEHMKLVMAKNLVNLTVNSNPRFESRSLPESISTLRSAVVNAFDSIESVVYKTGEEESIDDYLATNGSRYSDLTAEYQEKVRKAAMVDDRFFHVMLKDLLPNFPVTEYLKMESALAEGDQDAIYSLRSEYQGRGITFDMDLFDINSTFGDNAKMYIASIEKGVFDVDDENVLLPVGEESFGAEGSLKENDFVNFNTLRQSIMLTGQSARDFLSLSGEIQMTDEHIQAFKSALKKTLMSDNFADEQARQLRSFYYHVFANEEETDPNFHSLVTIAKKSPDMQKRANANRILFDIMSWAYQNYTAKSLTSKVDLYKDNYTSYVPRSNFQKDVQHTYRMNIASIYNADMNPMGSDGIFDLNNNVLKAITGITPYETGDQENPYGYDEKTKTYMHNYLHPAEKYGFNFKMTKDGLMKVDTRGDDVIYTPIATYDAKTGVVTAAMETQKGDNLNSVIGVLRTLGLKPSNKAIKKIWLNESNEDGDVNAQMLLDLAVYGMMAVTSHARKQVIRYYGKNAANEAQIQDFSTILKDKFGEPKSPSELLESVGMDNSIRDTKDNQGIYTLNDMYSWVNDIAKADAYHSGIVNRNVVYTPTGKKKQLDNVISALNRIFTNGANQESSSDSIALRFQNLVNRVKANPSLAELFKHNPLIDNPQLNPLMSGAGYEVESVVENNGITGYKSHGYAYGKMTDYDLDYQALNEFAKSLLSNRRDQVLSVRGTTFGDSSKGYYYNVNFGEKILNGSIEYGKYKNENGNTVNQKVFKYKGTNYNSVFSHMQNILELQKLRADASANLLVDTVNEISTRMSLQTQVMKNPKPLGEGFISDFNEKIRRMMEENPSVYNEFVEMLENSDLKYNHDYSFTKDGALIVGNAVKDFYGTARNDLLNYANYSSMKKAKSDVQKKSWLQDVFKQRAYEMALRMHTTGQKLPSYFIAGNSMTTAMDEDYGFAWNKFWTPSKQMFERYQKRVNEIGSQAGAANYLKAAKGQRIEGTLHPLLEAMMFTGFIHNYYVADTLGVNHSAFSNIRDFYKRISKYTSPASPILTTEAEGIKPIKNVAVIKGNFESLKDDNIYSGTETTIEYADGQGYINPIYWLRIQKTNPNLVGSDVQKPLGVGNDWKRGVAFQQKYSRDTITQELIDLNPSYESFLMAMLSGSDPNFFSEKTFLQKVDDGDPLTLADHYMINKRNGMTFNQNMEALNELIDSNEGVLAGYYENMIHEVVDPTVMKNGMSNVIYGDLKKISTLKDWQDTLRDKSFMKVDAAQAEAIQINPDRNATPEEAKNPSQIVSEIGVGDPVRAEQMFEKISDLIGAKLGQDNLIGKTFDAIALNDSETALKHLRKLSLKSHESAQNISKLIMMLQDPNIDSNLPTLRTEMMRVFASEVNDVIQFPLTGNMKVQVSDAMIQVYSKGNRVYTKAEIDRLGLDVSEFEKRSLNPDRYFATFGDKQIEITSKEALNELLLRDDVTYTNVPGEIVLGLNKAEAKILMDRFGIEKYTSVNEMFTVLVEDKDGNEERVDFRHTTPKQIEKRLKGKKIIDGRFDSNFPALEIRQYAKALENFLTVFVNRTPSHNLGTARNAKVVAVLWDKSSSIYTSHIKSLFDGSDFDVDQLTVYFPSEGKDNIETLQNEILDTIKEVYRNPTKESLQMQLTMLDVSKYEKIFTIPSIKNTSTLSDGKDYHYDFTTDSRMYEHMADAASMVGIFANGIRNYSALRYRYLRGDKQEKQQIEKQFPGIASGMIEESVFEYTEKKKKKQYVADSQSVISFLGELLNLALDNQKLMLLPDMGVTKYTAPLVITMAYEGKSLKEIYSVLTSYNGKQLSKSIKSQQSISRKTKKEDLIDSWFKIYNSSEELLGTKAEMVKRENAKIEANEELIKDMEAEVESSLKQENTAAAESIQAEIQALKEKNKSIKDNIGKKYKVRYADLMKFKELEEVIKKTDLIQRVNHFASMNRGFNGDEYVMYLNHLNSEFYLNQDLDNFLTNGVGTNDYMDRAKYMLPDDRKSFEEYEKDIRSRLNLNKLVKNLPLIRASLTAFHNTYRVRQQFADKSFPVQTIQDNILEHLKQPYFLYSSQYYSFQKALNNLAISLYSEQHLKDFYLPIRMKDGFWKTDAFAPKNYRHDLTTPDGSYVFVRDFVQHFEYIKSMLAGKNDFINNILVEYSGNGETLVLNNTFDMENSDKSILYNAFLNLNKDIESVEDDSFSNYYKGVDFARAFELYELFKYKMSFKRGSLGDVIGFGEYKKLSTSIEGIFNSNISKVPNIEESIIGTEDNLHIPFSKRKAQELDDYFADHLNENSVYVDLPYKKNGELYKRGPKLDRSQFFKKYMPEYIRIWDDNSYRYVFAKVVANETAEQGFDYLPLKKLFSGVANQYDSRIPSMSEMESFHSINSQSLKELLNKGHAILPVYRSTSLMKKFIEIKLGGFKELFYSKPNRKNQIGIEVRKNIKGTNIYNSFEPVDSKKNVKASKLGFVNNAVGVRTLNQFVRRLKVIAPQISVYMVDQENMPAGMEDFKGFVKGGSLFLNKNLMTADTPIHELSHIFLQSIQDEPIYDKLIDMAMVEMEDPNNIIASRIRANYTGSEIDLAEEYISTVMGLSSAPTVKSGVQSMIKNFWKAVKDFLKSLFNIRHSDLSSFDFQNKTVYEFGQLFTDIVFDSNTEALIENIVPTGKVKASKVIDELKTASEMNQFFVDENMRSMGTYNASNYADFLIKNNYDGKAEGKRGFYNRLLSEQVDLNNMTREEAYAEIFEYTQELFSHEEKLPKVIVDSIVENPDNIISSFKEDKSFSRFSDNQIEKLFGSFRVNPGDEVLLAKAKDTIDLGEGNNYTIPDFFDGRYIFVKGKGSGLVSIYEITSEPFSDDFSGTGRTIFDRFLPESVMSVASRGSAIQRNNLYMKNSRGSMKRLNIGLLKADIKKNNPGVRFGESKIISTSGRRINVRNVNMLDILNHLQAISTIDDIYNLLPAEIQETVKFSNDTNVEDYNDNLIRAFMDMAPMYSELKKIVPVEGDPETFANKIKLKEGIKRFLSSYEISPAPGTDKAYDLASSVLIQLDKTDLKDQSMINKSGDASFMANFINMPNQKNEMVRTAYRAIRLSGAKVLDEIYSFSKEHKKYVDAVEAATDISSMTERYKDVGEDFFGSLFKKRYLKGQQIDTREIHWDRNDPETKKALLSGEIKQAHLDYANFFLDQMERLYKMAIRHNLTQNRKMNKKQLEDQIELDYKKAVPQRGVVPMMRKTMLENVQGNIVGGDMLKGFNVWWKQMTAQLANPYKFHDDEYSDKEARIDYHTIQEMFTYQFGKGMPSDSILGSSNKLNAIGLIPLDSGYSVDKDGNVTGLDFSSDSDNSLFQNKNQTKNLAMILSAFATSMIRKIEYENNALPVVNAAIHTLKMEEAGDVLNTRNISFIKDLVKAKVYNVMDTNITTRKIGKVNIDANTILGTAMRATTNAGLALNSVTGVMSAVQNMAGMISWATKNAIVSNNMAGPKEMARALKIMSSAMSIGSDYWNGNDNTQAAKDFIKVRQLMDQHKIADISDNEYIYGPIHKLVNRKNLFKSHYLHWMNFQTDYHARGVVMIAQMMKDGSWDAYSLNADNELVYDEKKDTRFYKNGKLTPDGELLRGRLRERLISDGVMTPEDEKLSRGYSLETEIRIKDIADRYIIGFYGSKERAPLENQNIITLSLMQFRRWLPVKTFNYFGDTRYLDDRGVDVVVTDPKTGKRTVKWQRELTEGSIISVIKAWQELGGFKGMIESGKINWKQLPIERRRNITGLVVDLMIVTALTIMSKMIFLDDEDKKKRKRGEIAFGLIPENRYSDAFDRGVMDLLAGMNPGEYEKIFENPIPAMNSLFIMEEMMFNWDFNRAERLVPFTTTFNSFSEIYDDINQE